jgi:hypothetical protein
MPDRNPRPVDQQIQLRGLILYALPPLGARANCRRNALFPTGQRGLIAHLGLDRARELGEEWCVGAGDLAEVLAGRAYDEDEALGPPFSTYEVSRYFESRANGGRSRVSFGAADAPILGFVTDE